MSCSCYFFALQGSYGLVLVGESKDQLDELAQPEALRYYDQLWENRFAMGSNAQPVICSFLHSRADGIPHEVSPSKTLIKKVAGNCRSQRVLQSQ